MAAPPPAKRRATATALIPADAPDLVERIAAHERAALEAKILRQYNEWVAAFLPLLPHETEVLPPPPPPAGASRRRFRASVREYDIDIPRILADIFYTPTWRLSATDLLQRKRRHAFLTDYLPVIVREVEARFVEHPGATVRAHALHFALRHRHASADMPDCVRTALRCAPGSVLCSGVGLEEHLREVRASARCSDALLVDYLALINALCEPAGDAREAAEKRARA